MCRYLFLFDSKLLWSKFSFWIQPLNKEGWFSPRVGLIWHRRSNCFQHFFQMLDDIIESRSFGWILRPAQFNKCSKVRRAILRNFFSISFNNELRHVPAVVKIGVGLFLRVKDPQHNTKAIYIRFGIVGFLSEDLRCHINRRTNAR